MAEPPNRSSMVEALRYAQVGTMIIVPMLMLGGLGYWLDRRFGSDPWLLFGGLILGMVTGFVNFFRLVLSIPQGDGENRGGDGSGAQGRGPNDPGEG